MHKRILITLISILTVACATSLEYVSVPMDAADWKVGFQTRPKLVGDASYIREIIPKDDNINNWSKLVTIQYMHGMKSNVPPKEFVAALINDIKKACPDTELNIIESSSRSILYEWHTKSCNSPAGISDPNIYTAQHEVARVIFGNEGIHKVSYNEKTNNLNSNTRKEWISKLKEATLEKDGKTIHIQ